MLTFFRVRKTNLILWGKNLHFSLTHPSECRNIFAVEPVVWKGLSPSGGWHPWKGASLSPKQAPWSQWCVHGRLKWHTGPALASLASHSGLHSLWAPLDACSTGLVHLFCATLQPTLLLRGHWRTGTHLRIVCYPLWEGKELTPEDDPTVPVIFSWHCFQRKIFSRKRAAHWVTLWHKLLFSFFGHTTWLVGS